VKRGRYIVGRARYLLRCRWRVLFDQAATQRLQGPQAQEDSGGRFFPPISRPSLEPTPQRYEIVRFKRSETYMRIHPRGVRRSGLCETAEMVERFALAGGPSFAFVFERDGTGASMNDVMILLPAFWYFA